MYHYDNEGNNNCIDQTAQVLFTFVGSHTKRFSHVVAHMQILKTQITFSIFVISLISRDIVYIIYYTILTPVL